MKRCSLPVVFCVALLILTSAASLAVFPAPDGCVDVYVKQGWYNDDVAWYFCSATNNIRWAQTENITLVPKLSSFAGNAARAIIFVTNFNQGPIFSQRPGIANYSALWEVVFITWKPGVCKRPITNNQFAGPGNPYGIPQGDVTISGETGIILDCPILALSRISGPFLQKPDPPYYRIPQALGVDPYLKWIKLPFWKVFCDDPITKAVHTERMLITDAVNPAVVAQLKTNLAPRLALGPDADTQRFWEIIPPGPPAQLPVIEDCPSDCSWRNWNYGYSPVMRYLQLQRDLTPPDNIPIETMVNNDTFLLSLLGSGRLDQVANRARINAHVLCDSL